MKSRDKDYRYMATSDLIVELNNDSFTIVINFFNLFCFEMKDFDLFLNEI
jgi:hypothetical protein